MFDLSIVETVKQGIAMLIPISVQLHSTGVIEYKKREALACQ